MRLWLVQLVLNLVLVWAFVLGPGQAWALGSSAQIAAYFRAANENVGALSCALVFHERNVSAWTKEMVKRRDGYRCVICGSAEQLEVDHIRALQKGGDNDPSNLATLCDDCHTEKTKMDNSLRTKRGKICMARFHGE